MLNKKLIMLAIFLVSLLFVSAVSAADNATSDVISVEETTKDIVEVTADDAVSVDDDNQVSVNDSDVGTFDDLANEINAVEEGGVLNLTKNYKFISGSNEGININKAITIDGQGHTIDANYDSRIFYIWGKNVNLINIKFVNSKVQLHGGAIYWQGDYGKLFNSTFINCTVYRHKTNSYFNAGAVYWYGQFGNISSCQFINCGVKSEFNDNHGYGGAIFWQGDNGYIYNSSFFNNSVPIYGGAICWEYGEYGNVINCTFIDNSAEKGGAIFWQSADYGCVKNCMFINNSLESVFYSNCDFYSLENNFFIPDTNNILANQEYIYKRATILKINTNSFNYGDNVNFTAFFKNEYNQMLSDKNIIFKFEQNDNIKECSLISDNLGYVCLPIELLNLSVGDWNVTVLFDGDDNYYPCNTTATITVLPLCSSVTVADVNTTWDQETNFTVRVLSENKTIDEGTVSFYIDNEFIGNAFVVNGTAILIHKAPGDAGNHVLSAIYNGINYLSSNGTAKMFVDTGDMEVEDYDSVATFGALADLIENAPESSVLNLTKDYIYVSGSTEGIQINKPITIDGQGHNIDGKMISKIFKISCSGVLLNNTIVSNSKTKDYSSPISITSFNVIFNNCTFKDNYNSRGSGGVINAEGAIEIYNSTFINNYAPLGGSIYLGYNAVNSIIKNCNFIDNKCNRRGHSIFMGTGGKNYLIENCTFINTNLVGTGNGDDCVILVSYVDNFTIKNSTFFVNNSHSITFEMSHECSIINCYFNPENNNIYSHNGVVDDTTDEITFVKKEVNMSFENISFNYSNCKDIEFPLKDNQGNNLFDKNIVLFFRNGNESKNFVFNISNMTSIYNIFNQIEVGSWEAIIIFEGNDNYAPCNATATITVLPLSTSLTIDEVNATVNHEVSLVANVNSTLTVNEGVVTFFDGETNVGEANVIDGVATLTYTPATDGEHVITAIFNSTNFISSNDTAILLVDSVTLDVLAYTTPVGFNTTFVANVKGLYSVINDGKVTFYIDDNYLGQVPVVNGYASLDYTPLVAGNHTLKAIYGDSVNFLNVENSTLYVVKPLNSTLTLDEIYTTLDYETTLTAHVTSNNENVNVGTVTFYHENNIIGESEVIDGIAKFTFVPMVYDYGWSPFFSRYDINALRIVGFSSGNHKIKAIFNGNNYLSSNAVANMLIDEASIEILVDAQPVGVNTTFSVNVTRLFDIVETGNVSFDISTVEGSDYPMDTMDQKWNQWNSLGVSPVINGSASFNYIPMEEGYHNLYISYYNGILWTYKHVNFSIEKADSTVNLFDLSGTVNHSLTLLSLITSSNNLTINEGSVTFFDGKTEIGKAYVHEGIAALNYTPTTPGNHSIAAIFNSPNYLSSNSTVNLFVNTISVSLDLNNTQVSLNTTFLAKVTDLNGKSIEFGSVTFSNENTLLGSAPIKNGIACLTFIPKDVGSYRIFANFDGSDIYDMTADSKILNVSQGNTYLVVDDINATINKETLFFVKVISDNNDVDQGLLSFYIDDEFIDSTPIVPGYGGINYIPNVDGEHIITVAYEGYGLNYRNTNTTFKIFIDSMDIDLIAENLTVGYENELIVNLTTLSGETIDNGFISFYVDDDYLEKVIVENGFVSVKYVPLTSGNHSFKVIYNDGLKFADSEITKYFIISQADSEIIIDDLNGTVGHELTITVNVVSSNNLTINEGYVIFFDGSTQIGEASVVEGVATLSYTPTTAGEHPITAMYYSTNYGDPINSALLTVDKADINLSIDYINEVYFTNPSNFAININSNSKPVYEGKIKYYVNGQLVGTVDVYEGTANFDYVTDTTGSFTLTAAYEETDNYFAKNASTTFVVNKMPTTLSGESVIFDEELYKTFTTELKDNNNNGVGGQPVKIEVIKYSGESATFNGISDANGITIYDVGRLAGGMWYVTGIYAGDSNYISSSFADKFLVVRVATTTEIEEIKNPKVNHSYKLKANIHDENGKLVKEGIVQFFLDGVDIGSIDLSNNNGHQNPLRKGLLGAANPMFEYKLNDDGDISDLYIDYIPTHVGKHTLTAVYEGTTIYKASNSTTTFEVTEENTTDVNETVVPGIDIPSLDNVSDDGIVVITLPSDATGTVTLSVGGKDYVFDVKDGVANVKLPELDDGNYDYTIIYSGDSKYSSINASGSFNVNKSPVKPIENTTDTNGTNNVTECNATKITPEVVIPPLDEPLDDGSVTIILPSDATGKVTLSINGKSYNYLVENGVANIVIPNLGDGNYPYTITYSGDSKYSSFVNNGSLNVNKTSVNPVENQTLDNATDVNETVEPEIDIPSLDNLSDDGIVVITLPSDATGTVTLSVGGKDYVFDVKDGVANVKLPELENGNYDYTITYSGDGKYSSFATNGNMKVNNTKPEDVKPTPEVVIPPLDEPSEDGTVAIRLPGDATGTVTLAINGKEYYFAVVKGVANIIIPDLGDGNYPYTITYSGDSKYSSFTTNGTLNKVAQAIDPVITASNVKVTYATGKYYTIKVYGTDGELVDGAKVVIKVKGKTFKTLTTSNGVAKFKVTNVPGTYNMNITALDKSVTKTLTVKHLVTIKSVTVKRSAKKLTLQATLGKVNGKYLKNKKITFKFNGKKYTAKTDKKGVAKVTIKSSVLKKLKVGKKVTYQATYSKDTVKKTTKIKK